MNYIKAQEFIYEKNKMGIVQGTSHIKDLLGMLGNPQDQVKCLHIAGTNGKGSVFTFVENVLIKAGYRVGRYVSPTIFNYLERFRINQVDMPEHIFAKLIDKVKSYEEELVKNGQNPLTAFEVETVVAFLYFAQEKVDFALIECGMGGRLDATNVITMPVCSVISTISMDHMSYLGNSLLEITDNKSAIIRPNGACIYGIQEKSVQDRITEHCKSINAYCIGVNRSDIKDKSISLDGTIFSYEGESYRLSMLGDVQADNAALAVKILHYLMEKGVADKLTEQNIKEGLLCADWPGRLTKVHENPIVLVDGAHNEDAWLRLAESINKYFTNQRIIFIIGVLKDKAYDRLADILCPYMYHAILITPDSPRALKKEELSEVIKKRGVPCETALEVTDAYDKAFAVAQGFDSDNCAILVCGSLSFLKDYLLYDFDKKEADRR